MSTAGTAYQSGTVSYSCVTRAAQVMAAGNVYLADFHGNISVLVDPNILRRFMNGETLSMPLTVEEAEFYGAGAGIGPITMKLDRVRPLPQSTLTAVAAGRPFPAVQDYVLNVQVAIPNLFPGITLRNRLSKGKSTVLASASVASYPPENGTYYLPRPFELEDANKPSGVLATVVVFETKVVEACR